MNRTCTSIIMITILFCASTTACSLQSQNLSPSEFPWVNSTVPHPDDLYFGHKTHDELLELSQLPARRFLLETKRKNVKDVSAYVIINGKQHQMRLYDETAGDGLWTYDSPDICQSSYEYFFRLKFKYRYFYSLYGWQSYTRGSPAEPFVVTTSHNGKFVWYYPGGPIYYSNGLVRLSEQDRERRLYLQNLATTRIRVDLIGLSATDRDFSDFKTFDRSESMPAILECGESMNFGIRYVGQGDYDDAIDMLIKTSHDVGLGNWVENPNHIIITLTGGPGPG